MTVTPQTNATLSEIASELLKHDDIVICGHINPDGDCIGSTLALACALRAVGKSPHTLVADDGPVDPSLSFMPGFDELVFASAYDGPLDAFVVVDAPNPMRIGEAASKLKDASSLTMTIDHHAVPERHSDLSYTDPDSASTTMLIWELAKHMGISEDSDDMRRIATCCYAGLLTDTGRLMHQNTNEDAFRAALEMVSCGISPSRIAEMLFQSRTMQSVLVDSIAVSNMLRLGKGNVILTWISLDDMERIGATKNDAEHAIDQIRSIAGVDVACVLKEREGCIRGSLRSSDGTNVAAIAREFGGGGHDAAAGFTLECSLEDAIKTMESRLSAL